MADKRRQSGELRKSGLGRRALLRGAAGLPLLLAAARWPHAQEAEGEPFDPAAVRQLARELAQQDYRQPNTELPESLSNLDYDAYRTIRFRPERSLWRDSNLPFEVQFFHRGFLYRDPVDLFQVVEGRASPILYAPELFTFGEVEPPQIEGSAQELGFAGFRLHGAINRPDYLDEICAFLGASYFRAVAKGQIYGLSARGLSIKTAAPEGEEFPAFRAFWIERPEPQASAIVVHALLDGQSAAAAFHFTIRPGATTVFDVEAAIYPRVDIEKPGIATQTSMFLFAANDRGGVDDYRPAVHDSDGLAMWTGKGEQIWRPLHNPAELQVSSFADVNPRGFGLMQRQRDFEGYLDLEAHYERRPSLWIEPIGDWGEGAVYLVEIPTKEEIHDNVVAFWRPSEPLKAKAEYVFKYRMHWCNALPWESKLAQVVDSRLGAGRDNARLFVLDLEGEALQGLAPDAPLRPEVSTSAGRIENAVAQANRISGGWRIAFELFPEDAPLVELRAQLMGESEPLSEVWIYRWSA